MAVFSKPKTTSISTLCGRRDGLQSKLADAEASLERLRDDAVALADDPGKLGDLAGAAWQAEFGLAALRTAIQKVDVEISAAAEAERAKADRTLREATAREANAMADRIEKAARPLPGVLQALLEAVESAHAVVGDVGLTSFTKSLQRELPEAAATLVEVCRSRAVSTLAGDAPATLPRPWTPEIIETKPSMPTMEIFALASLQWHNGSHTLGPHQIGALPIPAAQAAIARGLAYALDDPRLQSLRENLKHGWPHVFDPAKSHDLDRDPKAPKKYNPRTHRIEEDAPAPNFVEVDRGEPYQVAVDRTFAPEPLTHDEDTKHADVAD